jgi:hypothetical protein
MYHEIRQAIEDRYNYANDGRVRAGESRKGVTEDFDRKTITYCDIPHDDEELTLTFPAKPVVCPTCDGRGKHVNPSIDAGGLSRDDFDDDPDFFEQYRSGMFDVPCFECKGKNVVLEIDEEKADPVSLKILEDYFIDRNASRAEQMAEMRMGA